MYRVEYDEQVYKLCLLGMVDLQLSEFFRVTEQTLNTWKKVYPSFLESMTRGKALADAEVAHKLYQRACGYSQEAVKVFNNSGAPMVVPYTENFPPDVNAATMWLRNRQHKLWRAQNDTLVPAADVAAMLAAAMNKLPD